MEQKPQVRVNAGLQQ